MLGNELTILFPFAASDREANPNWLGYGRRIFVFGKSMRPYIVMSSFRAPDGREFQKAQIVRLNEQDIQNLPEEEKPKLLPLLPTAEEQAELHSVVAALSDERLDDELKWWEEYQRKYPPTTGWLNYDYPQVIALRRESERRQKDKLKQFEQFEQQNEQERQQLNRHIENLQNTVIRLKNKSKMQGRPSKEEFMKRADECRKKNGTLNYRRLGKTLGLSAPTVKKWAEDYGIPYRKM